MKNDDIEKEVITIGKLKFFVSVIIGICIFVTSIITFFYQIKCDVGLIKTELTISNEKLSSMIKQTDDLLKVVSINTNVLAVLKNIHNIK